MKSIAINFGGFFGGGYGTAAVGDGRSERHGQLSSRLAGVPQRFLELLLQCLLDASLFFKTVRKASMVVLSRYRFKMSSNFMPRVSTLLAWEDVRVGFPSALMRDGLLLLHPQLSVQLC